MSKKVCIITGSRAEYGLLKPLIDKIKNDTDFKLLLIATGMHLSTEFGLTYKEIEKDKIKINEKIEILLSSDTTVGITKSMGLALISFSEALERLKPDIIVILGDRFEIFCVTIAAYICKIPIVHLHGGETTEGVIDEGFRHSITKMSSIHFTSTEDYRRRVIQLGENPQNVFNVGALGIENIKIMNFLSRNELEKRLNFKFNNNNLLITFHPSTLDNDDVNHQFQNLLDALIELKDTFIIFTKTNADTNGRVINNMIDQFIIKNKSSVGFTSLGQLSYLSLMQHVDAVVGNSSSGIIEAPSFKVGTINIGDRQKGRIKAASIIDCKPVKKDILKSINFVLSNDFKLNLKNVKNPYEKENTSIEIIKKIKNFLFNDFNLKKTFYDVNFKI